MPRRPIVGGNWKCNPEKVEKLDELVANINACDTSACDVYVCPSTLHIGMVYDKFTNGAKVTPQNCNFKGCGAYTGEMAADQFAAMGIEWCLIGHSERRGEFGLPTPAESSELLATKLAYLLEKGIKCVLAIGEPLPVREKGIDAVLAYCIEQLKPCLPHLDAEKVRQPPFARSESPFLISQSHPSSLGITPIRPASALCLLTGADCSSLTRW